MNKLNSLAYRVFEVFESKVTVEPGEADEEGYVEVGLLLVDVKDINDREVHVDIQDFLPTLDQVDRRPELVVGLGEDDVCDVLLVTPVLTVQELVVDHLRVNAGAVVTTEVSRLLQV